MPFDEIDKTIGPKQYYFDQLICARKTNSVMVMIIIHIAYITCLVTNDAWYAYNVIVVYSIPHGDGWISYFAEPGILWLAGTVMGEFGARSI